MTGGASVAKDALWLYLIPPTTDNVSIVRVPFDPATMKLASRGDTVYTGNTTTLSVTSDGATVVYDDGSADFSAWLLPLADMVGNKFSESNRVTRATATLRGTVSPDGTVSVVGREHPQGGREFSVIKPGMAEIPIPGRHGGAVFEDSVNLKMIDVTESSTTMYMYNYLTRRRSSVLTLRTVGLRDNSRAGDAWVWIPPDGGSIQVQRDGENRPKRIPLPRWYKDIFWLAGTPDGSKVAIMGYQAPDEDSLGVAVVSLADGSSKQMLSSFGEGGGTSWMYDGSLIAVVNDTPESETLYHLKEGVAPRRIGSTPRLISSNAIMRVSSDMKKAFVITRDDRRDVWMSTVVK
jgi:hypothetical protein